MNSESFLSIFELVLKNTAIVAILAAAAITLLVRWRTDSMHPILLRIWYLVMANRECAVPAINSFHQQHSGFLQFRFTTGVRVRAIHQIEPLLAWCEKESENIEHVAACGGYFDVETPGLKPVVARLRAWHMFVPIILTTLCLVALLFSGLLSVSDKALLQLKDSGAWIQVNSSGFKKFGSHPFINAKQCTAINRALSDSSGLAEDDIRIICRSLQDAGSNEFLDESLWSQRYVFVLVAAVLAYGMVGFWTLLNQMNHAILMRKRLSPVG